MKRLDIMVTENQETALRQAKADTGLTMSDLIRRALDKYLEEVKDAHHPASYQRTSSRDETKEAR